jgi:hypothetical protein
LNQEGPRQAARKTMLAPEDAAAVLRTAESPGFSASDWCDEHGVSLEAVAALAENADGGSSTFKDLLMLAVQLGYETRRREEPKGTVDKECLNPFFIVQSVVVNTSDGSIVDGPDSRLDWVFAVAHTRNEMAREAETTRPQRGPWLYWWGR